MADFYKYFTDDLADILACVFNQIYDDQELSASQKLMIIILIFKKGDPTQTGNYCPISLTNCDYKILAYILVSRLEDSLPHLIHPNQTAYMRNHFIRTNVCSVQDVISNSPTTGAVVLFLDFCKAFDSVNHILFVLLANIGLPLEFILWISIIYGHSESVVCHKNWLTAPFAVGRGVHQGCPLSCHLFNLVGQILIYSLHDCRYFEWWTFSNDPCSLYADDIALFLPDLDQLVVVLAHIQWVGRFTGLELNLSKTIAFNPNAVGLMVQNSVSIRCAPVKYLGAFLGLGDLSKINFENPLHKAWVVFSKWSGHCLTLDARIMVSKIFLFSMFTHVLNVVYITQAQIDLIQKLISDFVWHGWNKIKASVMVSSYRQGGMNMLRVHDVVHILHVKWMFWLSRDMGTS